MNWLRKALLNVSLTMLGIVLVLAMTPAANVQASGATDIDITLPDIAILHYFSNVDISITGDALGTFLTGVAGDQEVDEDASGRPARGIVVGSSMKAARSTGPHRPTAVVSTASTVCPWARTRWGSGAGSRRPSYPCPRAASRSMTTSSSTWT